MIRQSHGNLRLFETLTRNVKVPRAIAAAMCLRTRAKTAPTAGSRTRRSEEATA